MSPRILEDTYNFLFRNRAAVWTAVFTGVLSYFTYELVHVSETTNQISRDNSKIAADTIRASERAFLTMTSVGLGPRLGDTNEWRGQEFSLIWSNSGTTPARDVVIQNNAEPWPTDLPKGFEFPITPDKTTTGIGPKGTYGTLLQIPTSILREAWSGKARIFVWGDAVYQDVFPNDPERLSEFCIELTHITIAHSAAADPKVPSTPPTIDSPDAAIVGFQWQSCRKHNCYDEDCKDYSAQIRALRQP